MNPADPDVTGYHLYYGNHSGNLVITYEKMPEYGADENGWFTAQAILYPNGNIKLQYNEVGSSFDLESCTVGIENADGSLGVNYLFNNTGGAIYSTVTRADEMAIAFGDDDIALPVSLSSFTASFSKNSAILNWITESETDNLGFNLYRSEVENGYENGEFISLNSALIDGMGTTTEPTNYSFTDEYPNIEGHTYWYWLQSVSTTNDLELFGPVSLEIPIAGQLPTMTILSTNYPNPFNPETTISFSIKENEKGVLSIYNLRGQRIMKENFEAGNHQYHWNAEGLASGMYFYRLSSPTMNITKKMLLMK
jgi:type IX secretion system substrate protein